jgi:hypothetical protein
MAVDPLGLAVSLVLVVAALAAHWTRRGGRGPSRRSGD